MPAKLDERGLRQAELASRPTNRNLLATLQHALAGFHLAHHRGNTGIEVGAPVVVSLLVIEPAQASEAAFVGDIDRDLHHGLVGVPLADAAVYVRRAGV